MRKPKIPYGANECVGKTDFVQPVVNPFHFCQTLPILRPDLKVLQNSSTKALKQNRPGLLGPDLLFDFQCFLSISSKLS